MHLRTSDPSPEDDDAPFAWVLGLDFPAAGALVADALERLLRSLLGNDGSDWRAEEPSISFAAGKSWKQLSTNCESHSSSATSSFCYQGNNAETQQTKKKGKSMETKRK